MSECHVCGVNKAAWSCGKCRKQHYCSEACQNLSWELEHRFTCKVGLRVGEGDEAGPAVNDDDIVGIQTSDGRKFRISRQDAMAFGTLANLLEDASADDYIPLSTIDSETFSALLLTLKDTRQKYFERLRAAILLDVVPVLNEILKELIPRVLEEDSEALMREFDNWILIAVFLTSHENAISVNRLRNRWTIMRHPKYQMVGDFLQLMNFQRHAFDTRERLKFALEHDELAVFQYLTQNTFVEDNDLLYIMRRAMELIEAHDDDARDKSKRVLQYIKHLLQLPRNWAQLLNSEPYPGNAIRIHSYLAFAVEVGYLPLVELLLKDGRSDLKLVADENVRRSDNPKVVELLARFRVKPAVNADDPEYAINRAAAYGNLDIVRMIVRANPGVKYNEALRQAEENGHQKIVDFLLESGAADSKRLRVNFRVH